MICINNIYSDPYFNIAAEEYLFRKFASPVFMLWQNDPSVIIGRHQNLASESDPDFISLKKIKYVRRFSGGGAVYQDSGNINLTFVRYDGNTDFNFYVGEISRFLSRIGIETHSDNRNSLYIANKKISGCAQYIRGNRVLFHATLLFSADLNNLKSALNGKSSEPSDTGHMDSMVFVKSVRSPVTNISYHLTKQFSIETFKKLLFDHFFSLDTASNVYSFSQDDISCINELVESKYSTSDWNIRALSHGNKNRRKKFQELMFV